MVKYLEKTYIQQSYANANCQTHYSTRYAKQQSRMQNHLFSPNIFDYTIFLYSLPEEPIVYAFTGIPLHFPFLR